MVTFTSTNYNTDVHVLICLQFTVQRFVLAYLSMNPVSYPGQIYLPHPEIKLLSHWRCKNLKLKTGHINGLFLRVEHIPKNASV